MSFAEATTVYVPCDSSALSLGAEGVALAIAAEAARRNLNIKLVRNGSRGLYWLEPMIESRDIARPLRLWPRRRCRRSVALRR